MIISSRWTTQRKDWSTYKEVRTISCLVASILISRDRNLVKRVDRTSLFILWAEHLFSWSGGSLSYWHISSIKYNNPPSYQYKPTWNTFSRTVNWKIFITRFRLTKMLLLTVASLVLLIGVNGDEYHHQNIHLNKARSSANQQGRAVTEGMSIHQRFSFHLNNFKQKCVFLDDDLVNRWINR